MARPRKPNNFVMYICKGCSKKFPVNKAKYNYSKTKVFYCNQECYNNHRSKMENRRSVYLTHYRCRSCCEYVKHEDAIRHSEKSKTGEKLKHPYLICPNPNCKKIKLTTTPRHTRRNERYRMQLKEIIYQQQQQQQQPTNNDQ